MSSTSSKAVVDRKENLLRATKVGQQKTRRGWLKRQLRGVMCLYYGSRLLPNARCKSYICDVRAISAFRCVPSHISSLRSITTYMYTYFRYQFYVKLDLHVLLIARNYTCCKIGRIANRRVRLNEDLKKGNEGVLLSGERDVGHGENL